MTTTEQTDTLEQLIDKNIALGHKNPHDFYELLERELGDDIVTVARPYLADFIADMTRQRLNSGRRTQIAKITTAGLADPELVLRSLWVPSEGTILYKRIADMTADDFDSRAAYLERMMIGISRHAGWCRAVADAIRTTKQANTAGDLRRLPALPEADVA